jgi:hypothetical protein
MSDATELAASLLLRDIELILNKTGKLAVWPARAFKTLTPAERQQLKTHSHELVELAKAKLTSLPDTSPETKARVVAKLQSPEVALPAPVTLVSMPEPPAPRQAPTCPYCQRSPCVGRGDPRYPVLHANDPVEMVRRTAEATKVMLHHINRS